MGIVYLIIAFFATTMGTLAGLGGGVIIKPALDALGDYDVFVIGVLSSATVFSMALVSTTRRIIGGIRFDKILVVLAVGAILGGFAGKQVFELSMEHIAPDRIMSVQAVLIIFLLQIALFKNKLPRWRVQSTAIVLTAGLVLGAFSAFLGIGGGPINVAVLCMLFSVDIKEAAAGSVFIILFSQLAKLAAIALTTGFGPYDYSILWYMIPAGVAGGLIGPVLRRKLSHGAIEIIFFVIVGAIVLLNVFNIVKVNIA